MIAAVLLHDVGDELARYSHREIAVAILRPIDERVFAQPHAFDVEHKARYGGG